MSRKLTRTNPALAADAAVLPPSAGASFNKLFGTSDDFPELVELDVDQVHPNPDQPRRHFDEQGLRELADSIAAQGLLQPIVVKKRGEGGGYLIAAGERRWRAHRLLAKPTIFAIVTQGGVDEIALIENLQRRDLDPLEIAHGLARLADSHRYTQDQLSGAVGLSRSEVSRLLALRTLPAQILAEFPDLRDRVGKSHLFLLADADGPQAQLKLWALIKQGATIKALRAAGSAPAARAPATPAPRALITRLEKEVKALTPLRAALGARERERLLALRASLDALLAD